MSFGANLADIVQLNQNGLLSAHASWTRVPLGRCVRIINGFPFDSGTFRRGSGTPLIRIRDILKTTTEVGVRGTPPDGFWVDPGDVIVGMDGDFNVARWRGRRALLNQRVCKLVPNAQVLHPDFLYFALGGYLAAINASTSSTTVKHLSSKTIAEIPFPVPPRQEQERIVAKLNQLTTRQTECGARLTRIPVLLKQFREAVLEAAVSGSLTEEWREQARVRFPSESDWRQLADICLKGRVITYGVIKLGDPTPDGVPCLRTSNVRWLRLDTDGLKRIDPGLSAKYPRSILKGSEVLVNVRGTLGGVVAVEPNMRGWNVSREVAVVPADGARINPRFLALWIAARRSQRWLQRVQKGVAYTGINLEDLRTLPVAVPSAEEQAEILRRVMALFELAERIEQRHQTATRRVECLSQAILSVAFRGELVPQESAEETARETLERIHRLQRTAETSASRERTVTVRRSGREERNVRGTTRRTKKRRAA